MHLLPLSALNFDDSSGNLVIIFGFVIAITAIRAFAAVQRQKYWHRLAQTALDKGQPLPPAPNCGRDRRGWQLFVQGLIWIAVGVGMNFVNSTGAHKWAPLPLCVGAALLIAGVIGLLRSPKVDDPQNPGNRE